MGSLNHRDLFYMRNLKNKTLTSKGIAKVKETKVFKAHSWKLGRYNKSHL